ncbi:MAG TPA: hypothetical protein DCZ49_09055 [Hyphomonadaceae bacterium]|nr:hypothetical protein [Hyphomonadaceae bacterium]
MLDPSSDMAHSEPMRGFVRLGGLGDLDALPAIEAASDALILAAGHQEWDPYDSLNDWRRDAETSLSDGLLWVALTPEGNLCGFAMGLVRDRDVYLAQISVDPRAGRQGYGRRLVTRLIDAARNRGAPSLVLSTYRDLPWCAPFFARCGFVDWPPARWAAWQFILRAAEAARMPIETRQLMGIAFEDL